MPNGAIIVLAILALWWAMGGSTKRRPCPKRLAETIRIRGKIGLREALRLRDLGIGPFDGAVLFTMRSDDEVDEVGGLESQQVVSLSAILAELALLVESIPGV